MHEAPDTPPGDDVESVDPGATSVDSPATRPKMSRPVLVLGLSSLLNDIASEMVFPLLPLFVVTVLGGTRASLGIIEGAADSLASLLKLAAGHWSDRAQNRRWFILIGYGFTALLRPLLGFTTAPWQVGGIRLADRFGKGIRSAPRDALIADSVPHEQRGRAFGFNRAMDHAGAATGPLLATVFLWFWPEQLRILMMLAIVPGIILIALVAWGLPREPRRDSPADQAEPLRLTLRPFDRRFRGFLAALVLFTLGNSSDAFLLVRAGELGVPTVWLPALWGLFHVAKSFGVWWMGRQVDRFGPRGMIVAGWMWYAGVYLLFALASEAWHVWALFLLYAVFYSLTEPAEKTLVAALAGPQRRGLAFGWFNFAIGIATLPASVVFGLLYDRWGGLAAFGTGSTLALLASVLFVAATRSPAAAGADSAP